MRRLFVVSVMLVASAAPAQEPAMRVGGDPAQVMRSFLDAVADERWADAARFLDPAPLEQQRRDILRMIRRPPRAREWTVDDYMKRDTSMPRAVAEYFLEQTRRHSQASPFASVEYAFAGVKDTTALNALTSGELIARWLEAHDSRRATRRAWESNPACGPLTDSIANFLIPRPSGVVLGAVEQGDTAYVIHKDSANAGPAYFVGPRIATLRRRGGAWMLTPDDMLLGMPGASAVYFDCAAMNRRRDSTSLRSRPPVR